MDKPTGPPLAIAEIRELLASRPLALPLLESIGSFFGSALGFRRQNPAINESVASYSFEDWKSPILAWLDIIFAGGARREAASIVHELLHAKLATRGFPIPIGMKTNNYHTHNASLQITLTLANLAQHEIFIDDFLSLGFDKNDFVFDTTNATNIQECRTNLADGLAKPGYAPCMRGAWNVFWLGEWLSDKHGWHNSLDGALAVGHELFPETADADCKQMTEWINRGEYKTAAHYAGAFNQLLESVGLPRAGFAIVHQWQSGNRVELEEIS
jgi:hypothetical protein